MLGSSHARAAVGDRWSWLEGTTWYVPESGLLAMASRPSLTTPVPVSDQTVYVIQGYKAGYFWGTTAVKYQKQGGTSAASPSCLQLVGSVTPNGQLHLTFTPKSSSGTKPAEATTGTGAMVRPNGQWMMLNQMATQPVADVLLSHWAYMKQCTKAGGPCENGLPGVGVSASSFLASCLK
jgi:hypothetical protein